MLVWNNNTPVVSESDILMLRRCGKIVSSNGDNHVEIKIEDSRKVFVKSAIDGAMSWRAAVLKKDCNQPLTITELKEIRNTITRLIG